MTQEEFVLLNHLYNASKGRANVSTDVFLNQTKTNGAVFKKLKKLGYIDQKSGALTENGYSALEPYKVNNAVILAAGSASRFIPLSLEQPKGLYEVKGERLIERLIQQLKEAGIEDITIVLGYKWEMFSYLKERYDVTFIFNPLYNIKNNIESIYVARNKIDNAYICACDSYFIENPFNKYEYQAFYAGYITDKKEDEMYAVTDSYSRITQMEKGLDNGKVLLGHSFWTKDFSEAFIHCAEKDQEIGKYDTQFWEWLVRDNIKDFPPLYFKEYKRGMIHEFDYFEQLREFDNNYIGHTHSEIIRNIKLVFRCDEEEIIDFRTVSEGLTNTSFIFRIGEIDYIYRHPGEGTENIINRRHEKQSLIKAKEYGIDPTYIYMDVNEGWKISTYVPEFREPDYGSIEDSKKVLEILRKLHSLPVDVDYGMDPWEDALTMEQLIKQKNPESFIQYEPLKEQIGGLYQKTVGDGIDHCFCHGDTYKHNWMIRPNGDVILIDWEYSGYSDPGIDVGYYIVDAMYDCNEAKRFIKEYLQEAWSEQKEFHFLAYTAIIAYYWFVWAMYRESCGANIGISLYNWHMMAERYSQECLQGLQKLFQALE
ncbi:MAG: NTP transferase domain-containing protein [Lachnospiraceae bacterium]|nr:NTP transferase domain-containing protein [Lachnospiraceae bacterium]